jgi:preprotein translocase subunit SecG
MKSKKILNTQNPKVARLNKCVAMVAFLWFVASLALLIFAGSNSAHAAQPRPLKRDHQKPAQQMTMLMSHHAALFAPEASVS